MNNDSLQKQISMKSKQIARERHRPSLILNQNIVKGR